jgi:hypothetical protein
MSNVITPPEPKELELRTWLIDRAGNIAVSDSGLSLLHRITNLHVPAFSDTEHAIDWGSHLDEAQHDTLLDIQRTAADAAHLERDPQRIVNLATKSQLLREAADAFVVTPADRR